MGCFVQSYSTDQLDASLLLLPAVGFLSPDNPRIKGTIEAVERELSLTGWSCATIRIRLMTVCRPARARFSPAPSGWRTHSTHRAKGRRATPV